MEMGSRDAEALLGARLGESGLDPERTLAFRGRFDRLRKLECPSGVNTGKGHRAVYGWTQLLQLALALDLVNLGVSPEHAAEVATASDDMRWATFRLTQLIGSRKAFVRAVDDEKWPLSKTVILLINVGALHPFTPGRSKTEPLLSVQEGKTMVEWMRAATVYEAANIMIDLGTKIAQLIRLAALWSGTELRPMVDDFAEWAEQYVVHT